MRGKNFLFKKSLGPQKYISFVQNILYFKERSPKRKFEIKFVLNIFYDPKMGKKYDFGVTVHIFEGPETI